MEIRDFATPKSDTSMLFPLLRLWLPVVSLSLPLWLKLQLSKQIISGGIKFYPSYLKFDFHIQLSFLTPPIFTRFLWKANASTLRIFRNSNRSLYPLCDLSLQLEYVLGRLPCPNSVHWSSTGIYVLSGSHVAFQISTWQFSYSLVKFLKEKKKGNPISSPLILLNTGFCSCYNESCLIAIKCKWCFLRSHLALSLSQSLLDSPHSYLASSYWHSASLHLGASFLLI